MIDIAKLKIVDEYENTYTIKRKNYLKILNYEKYLEFFINFFSKENIYIENNELKNKEYILIDLTSPYTIMKNLDYSKGTLLYDYINMKFSNIPEDKIYDIHNDLKNIITQVETCLDLNINLDIEENIMKYLSQNIFISKYEKSIKEDINIILNENLKLKKSNIYIIFYNSELIPLSLEYDNFYLFDINQNNEAQDYNFIISDEVNEFIYNLIITELKRIWPINYESYEIENLFNQYFKIYSNQKTILVNNEKILLMAKIINKIYNMKQKIEYLYPIKNNAIKNYIDKL